MFVSNSEAEASELLTNIEEMFLRYYMGSNFIQQVQIFNHTLSRDNSIIKSLKWTVSPYKAYV